MNRGDIFMVDLGDPPDDRIETAGYRPAIAVSLGDMDSDNPLVTIIPLTKNLSAANFPHTFVVEPSTENGLSISSVVLTFQISSLDKRDVKRELGRLENRHIATLNKQLKDLLRLT